MRDNDIFNIAVGVLVVTLVGIWMMLPGGNIPTDDSDGPGPNLAMQIGGVSQGYVVIDLEERLAPQNVERVVELATQSLYNGVAFHRVVDGVLAQTGDVEYGKMSTNLENAGYGASGLPLVPAEFSDVPFVRGIVGMARGPDPDSADSQFFIVLDRAPKLDGQYTVIGHVVAGMDVVDKITRGDPAADGRVEDPDYIIEAWIED